jgi:uncharacterized protein YjbI with pentapeptide repeats
MRFLLPVVLALCAVPLADAQTTDQTIDRCRIRPGTQCLSANLRGANLAGADLSRADLTRSSLNGADLTKARLDRAKLQRASRKRTWRVPI